MQNIRRARKPQTGVFVEDLKERTGFRRIRRQSEPRDIERLREIEARKKKPPTQKEIRDLTEAVKKLEKKEYKNMKVTELRDELRERGLKVSGTKKELIKRLS